LYRGDAFCAADTRAFDEKLNCQQRFIFGHSHGTKLAGVIFRVGLATLCAAKALETIAVLSKTPALDAAVSAVH